jgi:hypothetical protein
MNMTTLSDSTEESTRNTGDLTPNSDPLRRFGAIPSAPGTVANQKEILSSSTGLSVLFSFLLSHFSAERRPFAQIRGNIRGECPIEGRYSSHVLCIYLVRYDQATSFFSIFSLFSSLRVS